MPHDGLPGPPPGRHQRGQVAGAPGQRHLQRGGQQLVARLQRGAGRGRGLQRRPGRRDGPAGQRDPAQQQPVPGGRARAAQPHPDRPFQHRLGHVVLAAVHRDQRGQRGRGVRQQRRPVGRLQQRGRPGQRGQRRGRRAGDRVVDALGHQLLGPGQQRRRPDRRAARGRRPAPAAGSEPSSTPRASSSAPVPISAGTAIAEACPVDRAHPAVQLRAAGQHAAPGQHGGGRRPGPDHVVGGHPIGRGQHLVGLGERDVEVIGQHRGLGPACGQLDGPGARADRRVQELAGRPGPRRAAPRPPPR